ncbi:MAG: acyl-CoA dehydrogenase family protein [Planctomycetes bacterium]|nr:acyl-CoA dehydrogenase family protein [Planctomycetota bacterium]
MRSDKETLLRQTIARFVKEEVLPVAQTIDESGEFPRELFRKAAEMGLFRVRYPAKKGGAGGNNTLFCILCEELAKGLMSLGAITAMQCLMGSEFLFRFGTEEQRRKYWEPNMRGERVSGFCLTEPDAGSDLGNVRTMALEQPDGSWIVNGLKTWVTLGAVADHFTVLCQTRADRKMRGLNFFLIERTRPGVALSHKFAVLGTRNTQIAELSLTDVALPPEALIGEKGRGLPNLLSILAEIRTMTAALALGLSKAAYEASFQYARERVAFGRSINQYQLIQAKIAIMATEIWAAELMLYKTTAMIDARKPCMREATMVKYFATEVACKCADEATRILGAYAYSMDYPVQRFYRDNRFLLYGGGSHEVLMGVIARELGFV